MRFLLSIYKYFPTGGLQKDALRIALKACERGHDLLFLTTSWEGSRPDNPHLEIKLLPAPHACGNLSKMREFSQMVARERDENQCDAEIAMNRIPGADLYFAGDECMKRLLPPGSDGDEKTTTADAIVDQLEEAARTTRKPHSKYERFQAGKWHGFTLLPKPKIPLDRLDQWIDENDANNVRSSAIMRRIARIDQPNGAPPWYLKVLWGLGDKRQTLTQALKWRFRPSRAIHIFKISQIMEECGFLVPEVLLAARKRPWRPWGMPTDILVTRAAEGRLVSDALCKGNTGPILEGVPRQKLIEQTARELARFHRAGFVHGDCHPGNIFYVEGREDFCYIDNDRTQKYPRFNLRGAATNMASMGFYLLGNNGLRFTTQEWSSLLESYLNELKLPPPQEDRLKNTLVGRLNSKLRKAGIDMTECSPRG